MSSALDFEGWEKVAVFAVCWANKRASHCSVCLSGASWSHGCIVGAGVKAGLAG